MNRDCITDAEWQVILDMRKKNLLSIGRNSGLEEAAGLAETWAARYFGASAEVGEGYRNLAQCIRGLRK